MTRFRKSVLAAAAIVALGTSAAKAEDVLVGVAGPMTGSLAAFGEQLRRGSELAVKNINANGGVLGKMIKLEVGDDACDPKQAVAVANDLVKKEVVFVAGHFCSGSSIPASAVYAEEGILQITPASTNVAFTDGAAEKGWKTVLRTCGRDDKQGTFAGNWLAKNFAGKKVAVLHDKSAYGKGLADETKKNMNAAGLNEVIYDAYTAGEKDYTSVVSNLKAAGVDAVYVGGYHAEVGLMMRQAKEQGLNAQFVSGDAMNSSELWSISGPAGEGLRFSDAASALNMPSAKAVVEQFRAENYEPEGYTLSTYAAIEAWAKAANAVGSTESEAIADYMRKNSIDTVIGTLGWDDKGDLKDPSYAWFLWKDGKFSQE